MARETILIVDDEPHIVELIRLYLQNEGYSVAAASDGSKALEQAKALQPALVILDLMLPALSGWDVCRQLRETSQVPIIMLTARTDDVDKIVGLELGADDYVTKPFNPRELVARVKAVIRRSARARAGGEPLRAGSLVIDSQRREASLAGEPIELRPKEFDLLLTLAEHCGLVLSREQLLDLVWGYEFYGDTRTVDVHVAHVRSKLTDDTVRIETVWGVGYKLVVEA